MNYKQQLKQIEEEAIVAMKCFMYTLSRLDIVYPVSTSELIRLTDPVNGWYKGKDIETVRTMLVIQHVTYTVTTRKREILKMHPRYERIKRWRCVILY